MKTVKALLVASTLALPMAAPVAAQTDLSMGHSMLVGGLMNSLSRLGVDTSNVDVNSLTLNQIVEIRRILENDQPDSQKRVAVEAVVNG